LISSDAARLIADLAKTVLDEPDPDQFLSHLVTKTLTSIDARGAILGAIEREGFLELKGSYGYTSNFVEPFKRMPLWTSLPITDAARTGEISIYRSPAELVLQYPHLKGYDEGTPGVTVSAPIKCRNTVLGAIGFTSLKPPSEGFMESAATEGVIALCGLYIRNLLLSKGTVERDLSSSIKSLTARQKQIIELFKEEMTTDQMAERLKYSASTIKQDIIRIYDIFGVNSRAAVVELAKKAGIS
jgi:DNA-binding CsgD family transcriptional regulator